jgi:carbohydrate-selective porin OprB
MRCAWALLLTAPLLTTPVLLAPQAGLAQSQAESSDNRESQPRQSSAGAAIAPGDELDDATFPVSPGEIIPTPSNPFGIQPLKPGQQPSRALHCDTIEHLKTPRSYRRLDSYVRQEFRMPAGAENKFFERDYLTGNWGGFRDELYKKGIDFYGCLSVDLAADAVSNAKPNNPFLNPAQASTAPGLPSAGIYYNEYNINQVYGLDFYSNLVSKTWKGGQLHFSFTYPESRPLYAYRNRLNGSGTSQLHGQFFTEVGLGDPTYLDQGFRLFEVWFQQRYGPGMQSYVRVGNIWNSITFNRSILAGLFNFWTFTEPCMLGTTLFTGNAPCYPVAPLGVQWYQMVSKNLEFELQVGQGYYSYDGRNNTRGINWGQNLTAENGIEIQGEFTYKGGTYTTDAKDYGKPWYFKLGGQYHTGRIYNNMLNTAGQPTALVGGERQTLYGNAQIYASAEAMLYRVPGSYSRGLTGIAKLGGGFWDDRNILKSWYALGLGYEGLIAKRPRDVAYLGWAMVQGTSGFVQNQILSSPCRNVPGCLVTGTQNTIELGYSFEISPWFTITPMVQYIIQPNTRVDLGDLVTIGVATRISF